MDVQEILRCDVGEDHYSVPDLKYRERIKKNYKKRTTVGSSRILFLSAL